jgi:GTP-dependent phosphoenolpyruvate carboxykinase
MADTTVDGQIIEWVKSVAEHTTPSTIHWCDGTEEEARHLEHPISAILFGARRSRVDLAQPLDVDAESWSAEVERSGAFLAKFGDRLPKPVRTEHDVLVKRLRGLA